MLGLGRGEVSRLLPEIIAFSELEEFIDTPVKYYSSGMNARLSFAVASHLNPTVFLVDEVLAVGDIDFQRKCVHHMQRYLARGGALILVSHSPYLIQSVCNRGIYLDAGRVQYMGTAVDALNCYLQAPTAKTLAGKDAPAVDDLAPDRSSRRLPWRELTEARPVAIDEVTLEGINGQPIQTGADARLTVKFRGQGHREISLGLYDLDERSVGVHHGHGRFNAAKITEGEQILTCWLPKLPLLSGTYVCKTVILDAATRQPLALSGWEDAPLSFQVETPVSFLNNALKSINQLVTLDVIWEK